MFSLILDALLIASLSSSPTNSHHKKKSYHYVAKHVVQQALIRQATRRIPIFRYASSMKHLNEFEKTLLKFFK